MPSNGSRSQRLHSISFTVVVESICSAALSLCYVLSQLLQLVSFNMKVVLQKVFIRQMMADDNAGRRRPRRTYIDLIGEAIQKDQERSTRNR